jgi:hypothetical protein
MNPTETGEPPTAEQRASLFTNTHWSQVLLAADPKEGTQAAAALEYLCRGRLGRIATAGLEDNAPVCGGKPSTIRTGFARALGFHGHAVITPQKIRLASKKWRSRDLYGIGWSISIFARFPFLLFIPRFLTLTP